MEAKFKVGDSVKVTNSGGNYTTYQRMADLMELRRYQYGNGNNTNFNDTYQVIQSEVHTSCPYLWLYGIRDQGGREFLVDDEYMVLQEDNQLVRGMADYDKKYLKSIREKCEVDKLIKVYITEPQEIHRYEKVTKSIFDLKGELECGDLYVKSDKDIYRKINSEIWLVRATSNFNVYRKVEIDHVTELEEELAEEFAAIASNNVTSRCVYMDMAKHVIEKYKVKRGD